MSAADDIDVLFAAPVPVAVGGESLLVRGVVLDELPMFIRLHEHRPADENAQEMEAWSANFIKLAALLCGQSPTWVANLSDDDIGRLLDAMTSANHVLFSAQEIRRGPRSGKGASWANAVAQLVECGHAFDAVRRYSLAQVDALCAAHARLAADRRIDELTIARAAQLDQKGYRRALAALEQARKKLG